MVRSSGSTPLRSHQWPYQRCQDRGAHAREWDGGDGRDVDRVAGEYGSGFEHEWEVRMDTANLSLLNTVAQKTVPMFGCFILFDL